MIMVRVWVDAALPLCTAKALTEGELDEDVVEEGANTVVITPFESVEPTDTTTRVSDDVSGPAPERPGVGVMPESCVEATLTELDRPCGGDSATGSELSWADGATPSSCLANSGITSTTCFRCGSYSRIYDVV